LGLDRLGVLQVLGGIALGLIALFTSYDHITLAGRTLQLQQQWGIPLIAASVATVFVDAQLATGSRLRATQDAARAENEAARERDRAAEARERQSESFKRLDQAALLSGRFQLDPTPTNRARFQFFLTLMADINPPDLPGQS
jgi:IS4 transposase